MGVMEKIGKFFKAEKAWKTERFYCGECNQPVAKVELFFVKEPIIREDNSFWQKYGFVFMKHDCEAIK